MCGDVRGSMQFTRPLGLGDSENWRGRRRAGFRHREEHQKESEPSL